MNHKLCINISFHGLWVTVSKPWQDAVLCPSEIQILLRLDRTAWTPKPWTPHLCHGFVQAVTKTVTSPLKCPDPFTACFHGLMQAVNPPIMSRLGTSRDQSRDPISPNCPNSHCTVFLKPWPSQIVFCFPHPLDFYMPHKSRKFLYLFYGIS